MIASIHIPGLRTHNELNSKRCHWRPKQLRRKAARESVGYALIGAQWDGIGKPSADKPWLIKLTRQGPREMDDDGVVSALKSVRDACAAFFGVDDKHRHIVAYSYGQERSREYGVRIEIFEMLEVVR